MAIIGERFIVTIFINHSFIILISLAITDKWYFISFQNISY